MKHQYGQGKTTLFGQPDSGAVFSDCGKYRYYLFRFWDDSKPFLTFIGLNPSTANASEDDPTIRRVKAIAKHNGFGGIVMLNLFAIISADPKVLQTCSDPVGDNDQYLTRYATDYVICAWGNFKEAKERAKKVRAMFPTAMALHINKDGSPKHPLYCKTDSKFVNF